MFSLTSFYSIAIIDGLPGRNNAFKNCRRVWPQRYCRRRWRRYYRRVWPQSLSLGALCYKLHSLQHTREMPPIVFETPGRRLRLVVCRRVTLWRGLVSSVPEPARGTERRAERDDVRSVPRRMRDSVQHARLRTTDGISWWWCSSVLFRRVRPTESAPSMMASGNYPLGRTASVGPRVVLRRAVCTPESIQRRNPLEQFSFGQCIFWRAPNLSLRKV